jgi:hypothetical protein
LGMHGRCLKWNEHQRPCQKEEKRHFFHSQNPPRC